MSAHELLALSAELPEEEADAEFADWMRLREPGKAAEELLEAAAQDESDALIRVQAASVVGTLGEAADPGLAGSAEVVVAAPLRGHAPEPA